MGADLRMGLDPRDCRCDAAMILGDASIPDDYRWKIRNRDKSCTWLGFIDTHFDPTDSSMANLASDKRITDISVRVNNTSALRKSSTESTSVITMNDQTSPQSIPQKIVIAEPKETETSAMADDRIVATFIPKKRISVTALDNRTITIKEE